MNKKYMRHIDECGMYYYICNGEEIIAEGFYGDDAQDIVDLLNEKEEQIQELEKDLNDALNRIEERSIDVQLLKEENRNLKKENEVKGDFRNFINEDIVRIKKENEQLKQQVEDLYESDKSLRKFASNMTLNYTGICVPRRLFDEVLNILKDMEHNDLVEDLSKESIDTSANGC